MSFIISEINMTIMILIWCCPSLELNTCWQAVSIKILNPVDLFLSVSFSLQWLTARRPDRSSPTGKIAQNTTVPSACRWRTPATSAPSSVSTTSRLRPAVAWPLSSRSTTPNARLNCFHWLCWIRRTSRHGKLCVHPTKAPVFTAVITWDYVGILSCSSP